MARGGEELHDLGEARRHVVDHDDEDTAASPGVDESLVGEEKPSRRSEGLDTLKCYLREIRHSTLLTFKQEQQLGKRVMAGDEQARQDAPFPGQGRSERRSEEVRTALCVAIRPCNGSWRTGKPLRCFRPQKDFSPR